MVISYWHHVTKIHNLAANAPNNLLFVPYEAYYNVVLGNHNGPSISSFSENLVQIWKKGRKTAKSGPFSGKGSKNAPFNGIFTNFSDFLLIFVTFPSKYRHRAIYRGIICVVLTIRGGPSSFWKMSAPGKNFWKIIFFGLFSQICVKNDLKCFPVFFLTQIYVISYRMNHFPKKNCINFGQDYHIFRETKIATQSVTKILRFRKKNVTFDFLVLWSWKSIGDMLSTMLRSSLTFSLIRSITKKLRFFTVKFWRFWVIFSYFAYISSIYLYLYRKKSSVRKNYATDFICRNMF